MLTPYQRHLASAAKLRARVIALCAATNPRTGKPYTQVAVARKCKVSKQRVHQIVKEQNVGAGAI